MVQPKTSPLSIRVPDDLLAEVDALAERRGIKRHAAILWALKHWLAVEATPGLLTNELGQIVGGGGGGGLAPTSISGKTSSSSVFVGRGGSGEAPKAAFRPHPKPGKAKR